MEGKQQQSPYPHSSSLLRDISNFRTPKRHLQNPNLNSPRPQFFTTSKDTPKSSSTFRSHRPSIAPSASSSRCKVARRLQAFELEQSKSARKAQIDKEKFLRSLAKSLTVWLNFLLQSPVSCGCDPSKMTGDCLSDDSEARNGKRERRGGVGVGVDSALRWRCPKRQKGSAWHGVGKEDTNRVSNSVFSVLRSSLRDICSFEDLKQRMEAYLSLANCNEIFNVMTQVTKNIDEGRLKMKAHCPIVTDVGLKEKALRILMCYNPTWLRIGLYIIFGGDSLLQDGDINSEQEIAFLNMVIEKQFFWHDGLARVYAYNKLVEGLYRPGYFEMLGNIILKRFLLLVLILDRVKIQSCLPIKYGIDGLDGGSPLLFTLQSNIKSSRQVINDFLSSDVMHGEGNLLAHLVIMGYKVSYLQSPLNEYDFRVTDLFEDLRDGVRLCRAIQLLQHDTSILMKMVVPSDAHKKNMVNCGIALQHLKQAGTPLFDEDGSVIVEEDIVSGDKELTLSLLWNVFVHLQLPLLVNKVLLLEETSKIRGVHMEHLHNSTLLDMLFNWIQAICESYDYRVDDFTSMVDGKAMWCLLDYYFRKELKCSCSLKDLKDTTEESSIMSVCDYTDAVYNFILSQKLGTLLGNFPEVLQVSDILEHNGACNSKSVIILLVFLSFQLIVKKNTDQLNFHKFLGFNCQNSARKYTRTGNCFVYSEPSLNEGGQCENNNEDGARNFKAIISWWQDMALRNQKVDFQPGAHVQCLSTSRDSKAMQRENAAKIIQSHFRRSMEQSKYVRMKNAVSLLQTVIRAWLAVKKRTIHEFWTDRVQGLPFERLKQSERLHKYICFMVDRHNFVKLKRSVAIIQTATRAWISHRNHNRFMLTQDSCTHHHVNAAVVVQKSIQGWIGRSTYFQRVQLQKDSRACEENEGNVSQRKAVSHNELGANKFHVHNSLLHHHIAATTIQSCYRGWLTRKDFMSQKQASVKIQSIFRCLRCLRNFQQYKIVVQSVIIIQAYLRGWIARRGAYQLKCLIILIQSHCRGWLIRRGIIVQKEAVIKIQNAFRCTRARKVFHSHKHAAMEIQRFVRGQIARRRILGASCLHKVVPLGQILTSGGCFRSLELSLFLCSVSKLQRWWRSLLMHKLRTRSSIIIQSHIRGWLVRREILLQKEAVIKIQSAFRCIQCWKFFHGHRHAGIEIQRFVRGQIARWRISGFLKNLEKSILMQKLRVKSATIIQSHIRGWIARREAKRERHRITVIQVYYIIHFHIGANGIPWVESCRVKVAQMVERFLWHYNTDIVGGFMYMELISPQTIPAHASYWKGHLARKDSRGQIRDLRLRVQKSAANVDDGMRIMNRLVGALSELLTIKSVSGILHTCATLDMATEHSQKCCEKLVEAGAVDILLKLILSVSRSIPDQEVLKHALSTLRNLARYSHLTEVLVSSNGCVETIFREFLRNKEEGYFIAAQLLKKIFLNVKGLEAACRLPALIKRLHHLVEDLTRKAGKDRRNRRGQLEQVERRLREAVELLNLLANG